MEICHEEGAPFFDKVTKAHCQVIVAHLDGQAPNWDIREREAATRHFFPALAEKFPQLLTEDGKKKFKAPPEKPAAPTKQTKTSPIKVKTRPSSGLPFGKVMLAVVRGFFLGLLILGLLWVGRGFVIGKTPAKKTKPSPEAAWVCSAARSLLA
jgi:hypothetical protein